MQLCEWAPECCRAHDSVGHAVRNADMNLAKMTGGTHRTQCNIPGVSEGPLANVWIIQCRSRYRKLSTFPEIDRMSVCLRKRFGRALTRYMGI